MHCSNVYRSRSDKIVRPEVWTDDSNSRPPRGRRGSAARSRPSSGLSACSSSGVEFRLGQHRRPRSSPTRCPSRPTTRWRGVRQDLGRQGRHLPASYGASGTQSKAVVGRPAGRLRRLLRRLGHDQAGAQQFVATGWNTGPTKGIVADSVVVIAVRKGNPKHITGWDDLIKPGIKIVTPGPGVVRLGEVEHPRRLRARHRRRAAPTAQAQAYLKSFFEHVVSKPSSGAAPPRSSLAAPATC